MQKLNSILKKKKGFISLGKVELPLILEAEKTLNLTFSEEYKEYVAEYGAASFDCHELTGICQSKRLNVVDVTKEERSAFIPEDLYVIERANYENIVIWQSRNGEVFMNQNGGIPSKIALSIAEYIK